MTPPLQRSYQKGLDIVHYSIKRQNGKSQKQSTKAPGDDSSVGQYSDKRRKEQVNFTDINDNSGNDVSTISKGGKLNQPLLYQATQVEHIF